MSPPSYSRRSTAVTIAAAGATAFFFLAGCLCIPRLGVENDEALFGMALFKPLAAYSLHAGSFDIPLMLMSYVGALKAWIYWPVFTVFGVGLWTLRLPALLAATASVWLFFLLLRRLAGDRAALLGCALLAVDSGYLLTSCFDWGPVALQHLLLIGAMLLFARFYQRRAVWALAGGFFLLGLALWDKALAAWMIAGVGVAAVICFPRPLRAVVTARRVALAALAFTLGALPLIVYNLRAGGPTAGNFRLDTNEVHSKLMSFTYTAQGGGLMGWMLFGDSQTPAPHAPQGLLEKTSAAISQRAGHPRRHLLFLALLLAILLAPLARGRALATILFALVAMVVAWCQMAVTANAGGSVHHLILLWPLPQMLVAVSFAAASRHLGGAGIPAIAAVTLAMALSGALLINEHYSQMVRNGGSPPWTGAILKLSSYLKDAPPGNVYCVDWGFIEALRILNRGALALRNGNDPIGKPLLTPQDRDSVMLMMADPTGLFLAHTPEFEFFHDNRKLLQFAAASGFERQVTAVIDDNWGRPVYEVYRLLAKPHPGERAAR